jgi:hypothetical protein
VEAMIPLKNGEEEYFAYLRHKNGLNVFRTGVMILL